MKQFQFSEVKFLILIFDSVIEVFCVVYVIYGIQKGYVEVICVGFVVVVLLISYDVLFLFEQDVQVYLVCQLDIVLNGEVVVVCELVLVDFLSQCQNEVCCCSGLVLIMFLIGVQYYLWQVFSDMVDCVCLLIDVVVCEVVLVGIMEVCCG